MNPRRVWCAGIAVSVLVGTVFASSARAQTGEASCDDLLPPAREVSGKKVGPKSCLKQETALIFEGRKFVRLDLGLSGTVDGYITKTGDYKEYLTNAPDLIANVLDPPQWLALR